MRVAVIGGGLFGGMAAVYAARIGHDVTLFEKSDRIFDGATGRSHYRLHRGYHYPRSPQTGKESRDAEESFRQEFWPCVLDSGITYYAVADDEKNWVTGEAFERFMVESNLPYKETQVPFIANASRIFEVREPRIDIRTLKNLVLQKLGYPRITVKLSTEMPHTVREDYDAIIVAAYAETNSILLKLGLAPQQYRYQVVEKAFVKMPDFEETSVVVVDGPYCCLDPNGGSATHIIGHVTETIHAMWDGNVFLMPPHLAAWAAKPKPSKSPYSRIKLIIEGTARFIPAIREAEYVGSYITPRAVLSGAENTDERPTLVEKLDDQVVKVFSGKLGTAVMAAMQACDLIEGRERLTA